MLFRRWRKSPSSIQESLSQTRPDQKLNQYRDSLRQAGKEIVLYNQAMRTVAAFTYQAGRLTEPAAVLDLGLSRALELTNAQVGAVVMIDPQTKHLTLGAHEGLTPELIAILTGKRLDDIATVLMPYLVTAEGTLLELETAATSEEEQLLALGKLNSLTTFPIRSDQQLMGALLVGIQYKARFSQVDLLFLMSLAQTMAMSLEMLRVREKLWYMAETLLEQQISSSAGEGDLSLQPELPPLSPLQEKLAQMVTSVQANMGAILVINQTTQDDTVTLAADYGFSPIFTSNFAQSNIANEFFPFAHLAKRSFLVNDLAKAQQAAKIPLLRYLQEESVHSLAIVCLEQDAQSLYLLLVASTEAHKFKQEMFKNLVGNSHGLTSLLLNVPPMPTMQLRSVQVPSLSRLATDDDLELLLEAMMAAEEEVEQHQADFSTLNHISSILSRTLSLDDVLGEVMPEVQNLLHTDAVWLYVRDEDQKRHPLAFNLRSHCGLAQEYIQISRRILLGDGVEGLAAKLEEPVFIANGADDVQRCFPLLEFSDIRSVAAVPLIYHSGEEQSTKILGVLAIGVNQPHHWQSRQKRLLTTVANQMAFAIHNAWLYAEAHEERMMYSVGMEFLQEMNKYMLQF